MFRKSSDLVGQMAIISGKSARLGGSQFASCLVRSEFPFRRRPPRKEIFLPAVASRRKEQSRTSRPSAESTATMKLNQHTIIFATFALLLVGTSCQTTSVPPTTSDVCPDYGFDNTQFCTAIYLPGGRNPAAFMELPKRWDKMDLKVKFLGGSPKLQAKVKKYADEWSQHCGIRFHWVSAGNTDIRVAFECRGHWSYLGRDAKEIDQLKATMNLQLADWDSASEVRRVVLHEFGHAIGLSHEHQHPEGRIPWDEAKVIAYYQQTQGWPESKIRAQVINRSNSTNYISSGVDKTSIMMYPIPAALTSDQYSTDWNNTLSLQDKALVARAYPPRS